MDNTCRVGFHGALEVRLELVTLVKRTFEDCAFAHIRYKRERKDPDIVGPSGDGHILNDGERDPLPANPFARFAKEVYVEHRLFHSFLFAQAFLSISVSGMGSPTLNPIQEAQNTHDAGV